MSPEFFPSFFLAHSISHARPVYSSTVRAIAAQQTIFHTMQQQTDLQKENKRNKSTMARRMGWETTISHIIVAKLYQLCIFFLDSVLCAHTCSLSTGRVIKIDIWMLRSEWNVFKYSKHILIVKHSIVNTHTHTCTRVHMSRERERQKNTHREIESQKIGVANWTYFEHWKQKKPKYIYSNSHSSRSPSLMMLAAPPLLHHHHFSTTVDLSDKVV